MILKYIQNTTPFTRIILWCTTASIISSFLILNNAIHTLYAIIILLTILSLKIKKYFVVIFLCILSALFIFLRINHIQKKHSLDAAYFSKPLIIHGYIKQVQHNLQEKRVSTILIKSCKIYTQDIGELKKSKLISIQMPYKRAQYLQPGQFIKLYKLQLQQTPPDNPYSTYLIKEGIWATGYLTSENFFISKKILPTWYELHLQYLMQYFDEKTKHLYNPLFLGKKEKDALSLDIQHQSLYWGIAHHMARSGIHLVTLLGLFITIFHYARIRSRFRFAIYGILVVIYAFISITSISFIRSLMMILFQMFSKLHGFTYSGIHAFALTTFIVIQYNPFHILFLDFQLSFGITAVIIWLFYIKWTKTIAFKLPSFIRF